MKRLLKILSLQLLTLLGFTACDGFVPAAEYGTPHVDFKARGTVKTQANEPIEGIQVVVKTDENINDTVYSDESGEYSSTRFVDAWLFSEESVNSIEFNDIDGSDNKGEFVNIEVDKADLNISLKELGEGWYNGSFESELNIQLVEKK